MSDLRYEHSADITQLPPPNTQRWVKSRKLAVIKAIETGVISDEQACLRYNLSQEELDSWKRAMNRYGPGALRTTHINRYRRQDTVKSGHPQN
jgi:Protein of unknown function (DUF1153)